MNNFVNLLNCSVRSPQEGCVSRGSFLARLSPCVSQQLHAVLAAAGRVRGHRRSCETRVPAVVTGISYVSLRPLQSVPFKTVSPSLPAEVRTDGKQVCIFVTEGMVL